MQRILCWYLAGLLVAVVSSVSANDKAFDWQPAGDENGVVVYTAKVPGSNFPAFKAVTIMHAEIQDILVTLADHAAYPQWYHRCSEAQMIEPYVNGQAVVRIRVKTPFPLADRDTVNQVTVRFQDGNAHIILTSVPERVPLVKGLVRMTKASGSWALEAIDEGTRVTHIYHADPETRVPGWMMNRYVVDGPIKTLANLRRRVEKKQG